MRPAGFDDEALFEGRAGDHRGKLARAHIDALPHAPALDRHAIGIARRDRLQPPTQQLRPAPHVIGDIARLPELPAGARPRSNDSPLSAADAVALPRLPPVNPGPAHPPPK